MARPEGSWGGKHFLGLALLFVLALLTGALYGGLIRLDGTSGD